jgi:hypothetical protein
MTSPAWVQRCPNCACCGLNVARFDQRFYPLLKSYASSSQLNDARHPEIASRFLCMAMLVEAGAFPDLTGWPYRERELAGSCYLYAAWALDDTNQDELARTCRNQAADRFLTLRTEELYWLTGFGRSEAILIDCLRRAGRGGKALALLEEASSHSYDDVTQGIFRLQRELIKRGDTSVHQIEETWPKVTQEIEIPGQISVRELAVLVQRKPFQNIADLMKLDVFVSADQPVDFAIVSKLVIRYGYATKRI